MIICPHHHNSRRRERPLLRNVIRNPLRWPEVPRVPMLVASGDVILDASGNVFLDASGNVMLDDGSSGCCYKQSRVCSTNALSSLWLHVADIPASGAIKQGSVCYYFDPGDVASLCPGTLHSGQTTVTGCSDHTCFPAAGTPCSFCAGGTGITPATWLVEIISGGTFNSCISGFIATGTYVGGSFCATQVSACHWVYDGPCSVTATRYSGSGCTGTVLESTNTLHIDVVAGINLGSPQLTWGAHMAFSTFNTVMDSGGLNLTSDPCKDTYDIPDDGSHVGLVYGFTARLTPDGC